MDSEHRHELKENDLLEFIRDFKSWWAKHGTQTLLVILVAVLALTAYRYFRGKAARELDAAWSEYASVSTPEGRQQIAGAYVNYPGLSNLALLDAADETFGNALGIGRGIDPMPATSPGPSAEQAEQLRKAAGLYQRVIDAPQPTEPSLYKLNARMGLAAVYETLGEWDKAAEQYRLTIQESGPYKNISAAADRALTTMADREQPVTFPPAPVTEVTGAPEGAPDAAAPRDADGTVHIDIPEGGLTGEQLQKLMGPEEQPDDQPQPPAPAPGE